MHVSDYFLHFTLPLSFIPCSFVILPVEVSAVFKRRGWASVTQGVTKMSLLSARVVPRAPDCLRVLQSRILSTQTISVKGKAHYEIVTKHNLLSISYFRKQET